MAKLKPAQVAEVKGKGFLINRGTENFSGRIVPRGTVFSPDDLPYRKYQVNSVTVK